MVKTATGNEHILVAVDGFTKYTIAEALRNIKAKTVAETLVDRVFTKVGCPIVVTSDQGRQMMSQVFTELAEIMGFKHYPTTPYHQMANGQCERTIQTIRKMLAPSIIEREWDKILQMTIFAYNTSINTSTKETPFYLTRGYDPILPTDLAYKINENTIELGETEFKQKLALNIRIGWQLAKENIDEAQIKMKENYDNRNKVQSEKIECGDLILRRTITDTKFSPRFEGPYRVIGTDGPNITYERNGKAHTLHKNNIKKYREGGPLPLRAIDKPEMTVKPNLKVTDKNLELSDSEESLMEETEQKKKSADINLEGSESEKSDLE
jgi:hypothetical protein